MVPLANKAAVVQTDLDTIWIGSTRTVISSYFNMIPHAGQAVGTRA